MEEARHHEDESCTLKYKLMKTISAFMAGYSPLPRLCERLVFTVLHFPFQDLFAVQTYTPVDLLIHFLHTCRIVLRVYRDHSM